MTREEAHTLLEIMVINLTGAIANSEDPVTEQTKLMAKQIEAIDMAIEALKTEPIRCGECENYIDRRCIEANHHVAAHGNCMKVFGAKRREL